jgi:hypothetical protein
LKICTEFPKFSVDKVKKLVKVVVADSSGSVISKQEEKKVGEKEAVQGLSPMGTQSEYPIMPHL